MGLLEKGSERKSIGTPGQDCLLLFFPENFFLYTSPGETMSLRTKTSNNTSKFVNGGGTLVLPFEGLRDAIVSPSLLDR